MLIQLPLRPDYNEELAIRERDRADTLLQSNGLCRTRGEDLKRYGNVEAVWHEVVPYRRPQSRLAGGGKRLAVGLRGRLVIGYPFSVIGHSVRQVPRPPFKTGVVRRLRSIRDFHVQRAEHFSLSLASHISKDLRLVLRAHCL